MVLELQKNFPAAKILLLAIFPRGRANDPVRATIAEINGVQEEMQKMVVAHMLEFKSMLDKDQQKKFFDLIQGAMTRRQGMQCP